MNKLPFMDNTGLCNVDFSVPDAVKIKVAAAGQLPEPRGFQPNPTKLSVCA